MGAVDSNGVWKYDAADTVSTWEGFLNLGMNSVSNVITNLRMNSVYKAGSASLANTMRDNLVAGGLTPTAANPILIYRTDMGVFLAWDGTAWKQNGNTLSNWSITGDSEAGLPNQVFSNAVWLGTKGAFDKFVIESGNCTIQLDGNRTADVPLKRQYVGLSAGFASLAYNTYYGTLITRAPFKSSGTPIKAFGIQAPQGSPGDYIQINYLVLGWTS